MTSTPSATVDEMPKGHPPGLYVLFVTEMWERFSYYGMRALLVLYLVNYFKWTQQSAATVYKWYTSLVYLTPLLGGYLADRFLGNKRAVVIGALLMAAGQFTLTVEEPTAFYIGLVLLIVGNGMFKPNMSTQVGRLYPENDRRRDSAYTIFYMGINLGAFLSPIVCGYLRVHYDFKWGFFACGVGMLLSIAFYLGGQPWVKEVSGTVAKAASSEHAAEVAPPVFPALNRIAPTAVMAGAALLLVLGVSLFATHRIAGDNLGGFIIGACAVLLSGWVMWHVAGGERDRVLVIFIIILFAVFFWAAFEQAGNVMNLWADQVTNRYISDVPSLPSVLPPIADPVGFAKDAAPTVTVAAVGWWHSLWNPVSTEWFQSVNSLAIIFLAPFIAMLWTWLGRRGMNPSIPTKMALGILLMGLASGLMILGAKAEDQPSEVPLSSLPKMLEVRGDGAILYRDPPDFGGKVTDYKPSEHAIPAQGGRLSYSGGQLHMRGVLADVEHDRILRATVPPTFVHQVMELAAKTLAHHEDHFAESIVLDPPPPGLDLRRTGIHPKNLHYDPATRTLTVENLRIEDRAYKSILQAASDPAMRAALDQLYISSAKYQVSPWWLIFFYVLSTVAELCLSPVGLSMVSKLAPARFATMLMGMWFFTNFFGDFVAGALGEIWGTITPVTYFLLFAVALTGAALLLFVMVKKVVVMMHGVE